MTKTTRRSTAPLLADRATELIRLARVSSNLAVGYAVAARNARDEQVVAHCAGLSAMHRGTAADLSALLVLLGPAPPRLAPTCGERLRWEWLASAARLIDGAADGRVLAECASLQREADGIAIGLVSSGAEMPTALRRILEARSRVTSQPGA